MSLYEFDCEIKKEGYNIICGVDEAGRGPLAGPVYACAIIMKEDFIIPEVNDSKKLSEKKREALFDVILENSSQNTVENILFALIELQRAFWLNKVRKVMLVTTAYHMRRSLAIARYLFPEHIAIVPCPANDNNTRRDNWMNTPVGIERAKGEAMNIVRCVINGVIPDFEI